MEDGELMVSETEVMICDCHSMEHQCKFWHDTTEFNDGRKYDELYLMIHLTTHRNFFKRLWIGIKYAFGYKCRFGSWDEMIFKPEDANKLKEYLNKLDLNEIK